MLLLRLDWGLFYVSGACCLIKSDGGGFANPCFTAKWGTRFIDKAVNQLPIDRLARAS